MLTFHTQPPPDPRGNSLPLKRCPPGRQVMSIVTCNDMLGCPTHYHGGRTVPCRGDTCDPCNDGMPWRWHSYVSAWVPYQKLHILFESTARASEPFKLYALAHGTLRGCQFTARRITSAPNSQVIIETKPADLGQLTLPDPPNVLTALSIIWNIPLSEMQIEGTTKDVPRVFVDQPSPATTGKSNNRPAYHNVAAERKPA